ncbi:unnamed protein product [Fraxinus pennsylvanica]|uniref:Uncharacterized protein n=1 Tax=Fraxinus pennsylvanica TaxID=56036 RepID=A0AAD1Z4I5_9LAMI|nr:unnamed protein product [Fraxinus pennsylvanica]
MQKHFEDATFALQIGGITEARSIIEGRLKSCLGREIGGITECLIAGGITLNVLLLVELQNVLFHRMSYCWWDYRMSYCWWLLMVYIAAGGLIIRIQASLFTEFGFAFARSFGPSVGSSLLLSPALLPTIYELPRPAGCCATAVSDEPPVNSTLVLAAKRTYRKDPLNNFEKYRGGWNISERHYWANIWTPTTTKLLN